MQPLVSLVARPWALRAIRSAHRLGRTLQPFTPTLACQGETTRILATRPTRPRAKPQSTSSTRPYVRARTTPSFPRQIVLRSSRTPPKQPSRRAGRFRSASSRAPRNCAPRRRAARRSWELGTRTKSRARARRPTRPLGTRLSLPAKASPPRPTRLSTSLGNPLYCRPCQATRPERVSTRSGGARPRGRSTLGGAPSA